MNETEKYSSIVDYSIELSKSIRKFDTIFLVKPPKQMGSFKVTLKNILVIFNNIKEIQKMRDEMMNLTTLDFEAIKDNKAAKKVANQINLINQELNQNYERLEKEFFKQLDVAGKQLREVAHAIKNLDERIRFDEESKDFRLIVYESRTAKFRIPLNEADNLIMLNQNQSRIKHEDEEKQIDDITDIKMQDVNKLEKALSVLTKNLTMHMTDNLSKEVIKEVASIKKVLPPKTIAIASDSLERLRHSSHLLLDLEQVNEILDTVHRFSGNDGKLKVINKQLESLKPLLEQAIQEEKEKNSRIKQSYDDMQTKIDYATGAVETYSDILVENGKTENNHQLTTNSNEKTESVDQLPPKYKDMKEKLKGVSSLYQLQEFERQKLSSSGVLK